MYVNIKTTLYSTFYVFRDDQHLVMFAAIPRKKKHY